MPTDSNGNHSLPPVYLAVPGQTVMAVQHNTPMEDISAALTARLSRNGAGGMLNNLNMGGYRITNVGAGTSSTDAATVGQVLTNGVPIGTILDFAGAQAPTGFLFCYGQAVDRSEYPDLDAVMYVGDSLNATAGFGYRTTSQESPSANRSTTGQYIVLPDARDVARVGRGSMGGTSRGLLSEFASTLIGALFGTQSHTLTAAQMPVHNHPKGTLATSTAGAHNHRANAGFDLGGSNPPTNWNATAPNSIVTTTDGAHTHPITGETANTGGDEAHPNVQPSMVVNVIIKAFNA